MEHQSISPKNPYKEKGQYLLVLTNVIHVERQRKMKTWLMVCAAQIWVIQMRNDTCSK